MEMRVASHRLLRTSLLVCICSGWFGCARDISPVSQKRELPVLDRELALRFLEAVYAPASSRIGVDAEDALRAAELKRRLAGLRAAKPTLNVKIRRTESSWNWPSQTIRFDRSTRKVTTIRSRDSGLDLWIDVGRRPDGEVLLSVNAYWDCPNEWRFEMFFRTQKNARDFHLFEPVLPASDRQLGLNFLEAVYRPNQSNYRVIVDPDRDLGQTATELKARLSQLRATKPVLKVNIERAAETAVNRSLRTFDYNRRDGHMTPAPSLSATDVDVRIEVRPQEDGTMNFEVYADWLDHQSGGYQEYFTREKTSRVFRYYGSYSPVN
jgi:hypothetical protein